MFIVTCPRTGHVRKFPNGRAAKRWLKEQAAVYVPTVEEDNLAFAGLSLQRNAQGEIVKARTPGAGFAGGNKDMAKGKSVKGKLVRKSDGKSRVFGEKAKVDPNGSAGAVSHVNPPRSLVFKDKVTDELRRAKIGEQPVLRQAKRDVSRDLSLTEYEQIAQEDVRYGRKAPHIRVYRPS